MFERRNAIKKAGAILEEVARREGVTLEEVKREISFAIQEAMNSPDENIRRKWDMCPKIGDIPTPEEAVLFVAGMVK